MRVAWILGICLVCAYFFIPFNKVRLGLDLKGGVHYELEVQGQEALQRDLEENRDRLQEQLKERGFPSATIHMEGIRLRVQGVPKAILESLIPNFPGTVPSPGRMEAPFHKMPIISVPSRPAPISGHFRSSKTASTNLAWWNRRSPLGAQMAIASSSSCLVLRKVIVIGSSGCFRRQAG
jgi:hypothetical protein